MRVLTPAYHAALAKARSNFEIGKDAASRIHKRLERTAKIYRRNDTAAIAFALSRLRITAKSSPQS